MMGKAKYSLSKACPTLPSPTLPNRLILLCLAPEKIKIRVNEVFMESCLTVTIKDNLTLSLCISIIAAAWSGTMGDKPAHK